MNRSSRVAVIAVLLVSAFATGALLYRHFGPSEAAIPPATDAAQVEPIPATLVGAPPVPKSLPDFSLPDLKGQAHSIREWSGRPLMINFWATWCGPCREEIPFLNQIRREQRVKDLEIVGIAVDLAEDVAQYVAKTPIEYPVLIGEDGGAEAASAFGVHELALPFTVFLDRRGEVLALRLGQLHEDQAQVILGALTELEAGRIDLAAAQAHVAAGLRR
ncbi:MAG: TlpA family protein disulfide reductase [Steroidobacteraceae bacterium]